MDDRRCPRVTVATPTLDPADLVQVAGIDPRSRSVRDFEYAGQVRDLDLTGVRLLAGRLSGVEAQRAFLSDQAHLSSVELADCTFQALRCENTTFTRVSFSECRLMGSFFEDCSFDNVLFENCRLDYATFANVRANGPVIFRNCQLAEAEFTACTLEKAAVQGCNLRQTQFHPGRYRRLDLRGSDLTDVIGAVNLSGVVISPDQEHQMAAAVLAGLDLVVTDTP